MAIGFSKLWNFMSKNEYPPTSVEELYYKKYYRLFSESDVYRWTNRNTSSFFLKNHTRIKMISSSSKKSLQQIVKGLQKHSYLPVTTL